MFHSWRHLAFHSTRWRHLAFHSTFLRHLAFHLTSLCLQDYISGEGQYEEFLGPLASMFQYQNCYFIECYMREDGRGLYETCYMTPFLSLVIALNRFYI